MNRFRWLLLFCVLFVPVFGVHAQEQEPRQLQAEITAITQVRENSDGSIYYDFQAQTPVGEQLRVNTQSSYPDGLWFHLKEGDHVQLRVVEQAESSNLYFEDVIRTKSLWLIALFFIFITVAVGWLRGVLALVGFVLTTFILFGFLFPQILAGKDPVLMTAIASIFILAINIHLAHGFTKRSFFSFLGTVVGVALTALFSFWFTYSSKLTGVGTDDAALLLSDVPTILNPVTIYLSAIILGAVGVLDDIAVNQSEIVSELQQTNPQMSRKELYIRAMRIGRHHIASTVNTLILVYVGAAMPMFLLAMHYSIGIDRFLNTEAVAEEIVRILAGTSALVLTVPIATFFATIPKFQKSSLDHKQSHKEGVL